MPHFLIENKNINKNTISIDDIDLLKHLSVIRVKKDEIVKFINNNKEVFEAKLTEFNKKNATFEIIRSYKSSREINLNICLCQSILNGSEIEVINNAVQVGVKTIQPVYSEYCSVKIGRFNIDKMNKIAFENFKQCERADIPKINEPKKLIEYLSNRNNVIVFGERNANSKLKDAIKKINTDDEIIVVIGPEGGFSDKEFDFFVNKKYPIVSLGNIILKAENAVTAGVSNIIYEYNR